MYQEFFDLRERPFDLTPNPRFLFMSPGHQEALSTLEYGIAGRKGITLLLGAAGTGKTTLVHAALDRQDAKQPAAIVLSNPTLTREEFIEFLALELGLSPGATSSKTQFLRELDRAMRERAAAGHATALIVDEAQAMPDELLEEVRLLANMETATDKLFPVVLVGQLELAERLNGLPQLKQRIALRATLSPLSARETASYIAERIRVAGGDVRGVFTPEAVAAICQSSQGIPRIISVICDNALVSGFATDQRPVGPAIVAEVCRDFDLPLPLPSAESTEAFLSSAVALTQAAAVAPAAAAPPAAAVLAAAAPPEAVPSMLVMPGPDGPDATPMTPVLAALPAQRELEARQEAAPTYSWRGVRAFFGKSGSR